MSCHGLGHRGGRDQALFARAGVGIAAIDDDRPPETVAKMTAIEQHRSGGDSILREHTGDRSTHVGYAEREIRQRRFLDAAVYSGRLKSERRSNARIVFWFHEMMCNVSDRFMPRIQMWCGYG